MWPRTARAFAVIAFLALFAGVAGAGSFSAQSYTLFGGSNTDSTEQVSPWIPIRDANRVDIRTWTSKAAFHASTDADSIYSDSIAVFRVAFTDSISSSNPIAAGDSVIVTSTLATNADTTSKMVGIGHPPIQEALRGPGNGSGIYTTVYVTIPGSVGVYGDGSFKPQYMRVYVTPLRRNTVTGGQSTAGKRVVGLKGLRMIARVISNNR